MRIPPAHSVRLESQKPLCAPPPTILLAVHLTISSPSSPPIAPAGFSLACSPHASTPQHDGIKGGTL